MNIYFNSFSSYEVSYLKESIKPLLTAQHKKILIIVSIIFGVLAIGYIVSRYFFYAKKLAEVEEIKESPKFKQMTVIEGDFTTGKLNGPGKITYPDGTIWEGEFKDSQLNGQGKMIIFTDCYKTNAKIIDKILEGEFKDNKLNGQGKKIYVQNENHTQEAEFIGHFKDNELHGQGKITYTINGKFVASQEGQFENSFLHGQGKSITSKGVVLCGIFDHGTCTFPDIKKTKELTKEFEELSKKF